MRKRLLSIIIFFALVFSFAGNAISVSAGESLSAGDVVTTPSQQYWIIFNEGYRDSRIEISSFDSDVPEEDLSIVWNMGLTPQGTDTEEIYQYYLNDDGHWEFMRTYEVLSDWATDVIASNLDVYDQNGNLIIKKTEWDSSVYNGDGRTLYYSGHTYYLYDLSKVDKWEEAKSYCESVGGHLATINDADEDAALYQYIRSRGYNSAYFGYSDIKRSGQWTWVTDEKITYTNWGDGEPNDCYGPEPYAGYYYVYSNGDWNDGDFGAGRTGGDGKAFICEWDSIITLDRSTGCPFSKAKEYSFEYYSQYKKGIAEYKVSFDPNWFVDNKCSYKYNHDIAKASIAMAMAGANTVATQIEDFYNNLGFDIYPESYYPTPTENSIGYAIAGKELKDGSTLIAVTVRGGQYHEEWVSNFTVGASSEHYGFAEAATNVVAGIKKYISNHDISGDKKIWITGYSRAAATTNIAAKYLDVMAEQTNEIENLEAKDIYAYCFECPRTVINPPKTNLTNNIFNIVNYIDFVTEVAPSVWNYTRYGITMTLPGDEVTSHKTFSSRFQKMNNEYKKILTFAGVDKEPSTEYMTSQGKFIRESFRKLGNYLGFYQSGLEGAVHYSLAYQKQLQDVGRAYGKSEGFARILKEAFEAFPAFVATHGVLEARMAKNGTKIAAAHYPELCLAWMNTLSSKSDFEMDPDRIYRVDCPVDVSVYDDEDSLVAQIINDEVQDIQGENLPVYIDEDGQKVISIPSSEKYRIVIKARENCDVSCQIEERDLSSGDTLRVVNYYDISMEKDQKLDADVPVIEEDLTEEYPIAKESGDDISPTNELIDIGNYVLQLEEAENGSIQGGGIYVKGEFAEVSATPDEGYSFTGWYEDDKLVSKESTYRFRMEKDHKLIAEFRDSDSLIGDCNDDKEVDAKDLTVLARHLAKIELITDNQLLKNADVSQDDSITAEDLTCLAKYVAKIITSL